MLEVVEIVVNICMNENMKMNLCIIPCPIILAVYKNSIRDARTPQPWEIFSTP